MTAQRVASGEAEFGNIGINCLIPNLRERLCDLPGVGSKDRKCVMLFAYERIRAFPIDVWIERILREQYFNPKSKVRRRRWLEFAAKYFCGHGGYAQLYLFHYARKIKARAKGVRKNPSLRSGMMQAGHGRAHTEHEGQVVAARFVRGDRCDILSPRHDVKTARAMLFSRAGADASAIF